jgi:hypothetical protein
VEIEEVVEIVEDVLVKMVGGRSGDSTRVTTVVEDRTCNEVEGTVGERDRDDAEADTDTIAVSVRKHDKDEEVIIDGNSLKGLPSIVVSRLGSVEAEAVGHKKDTLDRMSGPSGRAMD